MASDNFTRANEDPLASPWGSISGAGTLRVVSNLCANSSGTDATSYMRYTTSSATDSSVTISVVGGGNTDAGPAICLDGSGNGYAFLNSANFQLYIFELPGFGTAANVGGSNFAASDVVRLRRSGNDVIGSVNGVDVITATNNTTFTSGAPGIFIFHANTRFSNWTDGAAAGATVYNRTIFDSPIFNSRVIR
jgi:hypothetical protein